MDYGALPPEVNSGRMYVGPGAGPMLAAAVAWDGLATDLYATAACYGSVISDLTGVWSGPASASMAAAAVPYVAWLNATAAQAEQTASRAKAAVAAYEAAFAMTVPPPVIAANRTQLMILIATNFFGQNLPAIAATEAHYAEMWAQDAVAMYDYAGGSAGASTLTAFDQSPPTTNPAGQAGQAAAIAHATHTAAGTSAQSVPSALQALALPTSSSSSSTSGPWGLGPILGGLLGGSSGSSDSSSSPLSKLLVSMYSDTIKFPYHSMGDTEHFLTISEGMTPAAGASNGAEPAVGLSGLGGILGGQPGGGAPMSGGVSAGMGNAGAVGNLSVPSSWAQAAPATSLASTASPLVGASAASGGKAEGLLRGIPLAGAGLPRRSGGEGFGRRYGFRQIVMPRPLAGG